MATGTMTQTPRRMSRRAAATLRLELLHAGWSALEDPTDFRRFRVGGDHAGQERTIAYFPEFADLGARMAMVHPDRVPAPEQAGFVEIYVAVADGNGTARWTPID